MSTGLYSHTTRGIGTVLTAAIYNADHANHITNANPTMHGGYSDSVPQMRLTVDPGSIGSEVLTGTLAGEIERLRFVIKRITGTSQWYEAPATSLGLIGGGIPLTLAFAATPLNLRRTENNTSALEIMTWGSGSGIGNKFIQQIVGTGSNAAAELRMLLGATELERLAVALRTHFIGQEFRSFLDFKEMTPPATPAADIARLYTRDNTLIPGITKLYYKDPAGKEYPLGSRGNRAYVSTTTYVGITAQISLDDTVPTTSQGTQVLATPLQLYNAGSTVRVKFSAMVSPSIQCTCVCAMFRGSVCIGARGTTVGADLIDLIEFDVEDTPGSVGPHTYSVRVGPHIGATVYVNGRSSGRLFGGQSRATLFVEEVL